jgi:glycosyltransferase involved in cell wall biosynthesis
VGRLVRQKGFDRMIDAMASDTLRQLPWQWVIVGSGPEEAALRAQLQARGLSDRVRIETDRRGSDLYPSADLVLCPSRSEGFPLVPMEAVEAGVCVKVSKIAAHEELFAKAPSALLPEDEREWPEVLAPLIQSDRRRQDERAAQRKALPQDLRSETDLGYARIYERAAHTAAGR